MILAMFIFAWFALGYLAAAAACASFENYSGQRNRRDLRENLGLYSLFYLLGPVSFVAMFFATGFFQYGFQWRWPTTIKRNAK